MSTSEPEWDIITRVLTELHEAEVEGRGNRAREVLLAEVGGSNARASSIARRIRDAGFTEVYLAHDGPLFLAALSPAGSRAIGQWPPSEFAAAVIAALTEAEAEADPQTKPLYRRALESVRAVGEGTAGEVLGAVITAQINRL